MQALIHTIDAIDAVLPQTQCTKCGFDGCRPYAEAIARDEADIDRCPPGGDAGIAALARLTDRPIIALDRSRGEPGPLRVAVIDEAHCIGCTLCIQACPVDAIVGANKRMHTVLADWCTGCDLCLPPCPVDCIRLEPAAQPDWRPADAALARTRHDRRQARLAPPPASRPTATTTDTPARDDAHKQAAVQAALARARARRNAPPPGQS